MNVQVGNLLLQWPAADLSQQLRRELVRQGLLSTNLTYSMVCAHYGYITDYYKRAYTTEVFMYTYDSPGPLAQGVFDVSVVFYFSFKLTNVALHVNWQSFSQQTPVSSTLSIHSLQFYLSIFTTGRQGCHPMYV